jgi:hypothetical protein
MKLLRDTLTNPNTGRFSRKSATALYCFTMSLACFVLDTLSSYQVKDVYFETFFWGGMAMLGVTVGEKLGSKVVEKRKEVQA